MFDIDTFSKDESIIQNLMNSEKITLIEKSIIIDMYISYKLYIVNGFKFNKESCYDEIINLNSNMLYTLQLNNVFFTDMLIDIVNIIKNKSLKTNFCLYIYDIDPYIYLNIIAKSMLYLDFNFIKEDTALLGNMLHRNVIISNIKQNIEALNLLNLNKDIRKNVIKIIMSLGELISHKKILIKEKKKLKSHFYLKLNIITKFKYTDYLYINYSMVSFKYTNTYLIGASHLTICRFRKKSYWQLSENLIDLNPIIKLAKQAINIDFNDWDNIKISIINNILQKYNINHSIDADITDILNELIFQKNEQNSLIKLVNTKYVSKKNLKKTNTPSDSKYTLKKALEKDLDNFDFDIKILNDTNQIIKFNKIPFEGEIFRDNFKEEVFDNDMLSKIEFETNNLSSVIQKLYYIMIAEKAKDIQYPVYIPYYYDFRGRMYPKSSIGFTYLKFLRASYILQDNCTYEDINLQSSKYYQNIINLNIKIDMEILNIDITNTDKYYLIIHLLELGKHFKNLNITENGLNLQNIIDLGLTFFKTQNYIDINLEVDELNYIRRIIKNINLFLKTKKFNNIMLIRDSTASFLQHWGVNLGVKKEFLNKLNLNGDVWYDTYTLIISVFISKNIKYTDIKYKNILKRKILKNFIMIVNYNAGVKKCYSNLKNILDTNKILYEDIDLDIFCDEFYIFLKNDLFCNLFLNQKDDFLKNIGNVFSCWDNTTINLAYLTHKIIKEDIKIKDYRWIITRYELNNKYCEWKTKIAINANIIQAGDAELARYLINHIDTLTVHDSFGVNLFQIHKLMDLTNLYFNTKLCIKTYSNFILI